MDFWNFVHDNFSLILCVINAGIQRTGATNYTTASLHTPDEKCAAETLSKLQSIMGLAEDHAQLCISLNTKEDTATF